MRIVIDLQGLQGPNFYGSVAQSQIKFLKALISNCPSYKIDLLLNGNLLDSAELIKLELSELIQAQNFHIWYPISSVEKLTAQHVWNRQVSELIREALINRLQPDVVLLTSLTQDLSNDIVIASGNFNKNGLTAMIYEITETITQENNQEPETALCYKSEADNLNNAQIIICLSEAAEKKCLSVVANPFNKTVLCAQNELSDKQATHLALSTINQLQHSLQVLRANTVQAQYGSKKRLAYVSPLPPDRTGIADYSAELLPELSKYYDIDVIIVQQEVISPAVEKTCVFANIDWFYANSDQYDQVIYHFGNSRHYHWHMFDLLQAIPGIVVLHDFYLSGVLSDLELVHKKNNVWSEALYSSHGYEAVQHRLTAFENEEVIAKWPCNLAVIQNALAVIVHSEYSKNLIHQWYPQVNLNDVFHIPLLRLPYYSSPDLKKLARAKLGLNNEDFVVCSFGIVAQPKLHHRLLAAWLDSTLAQDKNCTLIFVGNYPDSEYQQVLDEVLATKTFNNKFKVTGWVSQETYHDYLNAADVGVQLRTLSRGETSAAVLDCMNFGLATIINANGSMSSIDETAVYKLPDDFENSQLTKALEDLFEDEAVRNQLANNAQNLVHSLHKPEKCVTEYVAVIEKTSVRKTEKVSELAKQIMDLPTSSINNTDLQLAAVAIDRTLVKKWQHPQIFVDVTELRKRDLKTGIQRVIKAVLKKWLLHPPAGFRVEPVYANNFDKGYKYAKSFTLELMGLPKDALEDDLISYQAGDIFLGLDLVLDIIQIQKTYLKELQNSGVQVKFVIYDLLPILQPQHFLDFIEQEFTHWLDVVCQFDGAICISRAVADDLKNWLIKTNHQGQKSLIVDWFHLGADIEQTFKSNGLSNSAHYTLEKLNHQINFLMVGTIESRKGHQQVLDAYEILRRQGCNINLIIVGKQGWKVEKLIRQIKNNPQLNKSLFWLEGVSDEYLEKLYASSSCLIAASYGEGFGLPLIEAAQHQLPILARDIPVFKEVVGEHGYYFSGLEVNDLAKAIKNWIDLYKQNHHPKSNHMPWLTWDESIQQLEMLVLKKATIS